MVKRESNFAEPREEGDLPAQRRDLYPESELSRGIVRWEGQNDPANPSQHIIRWNYNAIQLLIRELQKSPPGRKLIVLCLVSTISFLSSLASSIPAPGVPLVNADFNNNSRIIGSLSVSICVLGLAVSFLPIVNLEGIVTLSAKTKPLNAQVGPLILSPLSEIHDHEVVLNSANIWMTTWKVGWAVEKHTHWIVPILGLAPFGFGMMGIFAPIQTYVIDIGGGYAALVLAGITTARCIFGAFLPLAGPPMYASLGLGWGNSLLGFIGLGLIPAPLLIVK